MRNVKLAEDLGFDTYWAAQGHFSEIGSPSSLILLAAAAQHVQKVRLGTAVITLAFEQPLRLAENVAVVNTLSGDRLEVGVGKGNPRGRSSAAHRAYGTDERLRTELFEQSLTQFRQSFSESQTSPSGTNYGFYPDADGVERRIWQATSSPDTAARAGAAGDGLQIHSVGRQPLGETQRRVVDAYLEHLQPGTEPRIAVTRSVLPAETRDEAIALLHEEILDGRVHVASVEGVIDAEDVLEQSQTVFGTPTSIAEQLDADAAFRMATHCLFRIPLGIETLAYRASMRAIATEVFPQFLKLSEKVSV